MEVLKWLLFCMVLINCGYDEMRVCGLECLTCFDRKGTPTAKDKCPTMPCNNEVDVNRTRTLISEQIDLEDLKGITEILNKQNEPSSRDVDGTTPHFVCFTIDGNWEIDPEKLKEAGLNTTGGSHTIPIIAQGCGIQYPEVPTMNICHTWNESRFIGEVNICDDEPKNGKPCNFGIKCNPEMNSRLDCLICAYLKGTSAAKEKCQTLPCNTVGDYNRTQIILQEQLAEIGQSNSETLNKQNELSARDDSGTGFKFACLTGDVKLERKDGSRTMSFVVHGCDNVDTKKLASNTCQRMPDQARLVGEFYYCVDKPEGAKPCNFDNKCDPALKSKSSKLMPFATGLYVLILIGIGTIKHSELFWSQ